MQDVGAGRPRNPATEKGERAMTQRAVGYIRVSDSSQVRGHSLDAQRAEIGRYCEHQGYELVKVYADEGVSAYSDKIAKRMPRSA